MEGKPFLWVGILLVLSGCGLTDRLSTKAVRDDELGVYFRVPKNWTSSSEDGALTVTEPSGIKINITSAPLPAMNDVVGTDEFSRDLMKDFRKQNYETELGEGWRLSGLYTRTIRMTKGSEAMVIWVTAVSSIATVYEIRMSGKKEAIESSYSRIENNLKKDFLFTKVHSILMETPLWTITSSNYGGFMFGLLVVICILFMGRYFFVDIWRLIRAPSDVFRDLAHSEGILYPIFWILLSAFLAGAIYGSLLPGEIARIEARIWSQAEQVRPTVKGMTTDPFLQELLVQDVRERAVQPIVNYLEAVLFFVPAVVLGGWVVFSILLFIVLKIFRGRVALFATMKSVTILFGLWSLAGGLVYAGQTSSNTVQAYAGYALAGWGVILILIMIKEMSRVNFGTGLAGFAIAAGIVGYGMYYLKTSQFEPVETKMRAAMVPNKQLVDVFQTPFSAGPASSSASGEGSPGGSAPGAPSRIPGGPGGAY